MESTTLSDMLRDAYSGRPVFVTGHTGFKGSWLCLWLESMGAEVTGYALKAPSEPDHFSRLKLNGTYIESDIRDRASLEKAFTKANPEIVFHLAAQPIVRLSYTDPVETYSTNVMGTLHVFEACRKTASVRAIVNITSDKCYENRETLDGYLETDPMGGHDPYSSSKGCAEILTSSYRRSYFSSSAEGTGPKPLLASGRAGNVIGGGDWAADRLIPDIVRATMASRATEVRRPKSVRPWQHVLEPLHGYLKLGAKLLAGESSAADGWNFGPALDDSRDVQAMAMLFHKEWPKAEFNFATTSSGVHEAGLLRLDVSKATSQLGWKPILSLEETVAWTAKWYRAFVEKNEIVSVAQLNAFEERL
jgi:CDP-glucose 4,6-dehydratase